MWLIDSIDPSLQSFGRPRVVLAVPNLSHLVNNVLSLARGLPTYQRPAPLGATDISDSCDLRRHAGASIHKKKLTKGLAEPEQTGYMPKRGPGVLTGASGAAWECDGGAEAQLGGSAASLSDLSGPSVRSRV